MALNLHHEAKVTFSNANPATQAAAEPILELLSAGFQVTRFKETGHLLWLAFVKPSSAIAEHFGLKHECFVIGNGYPNDFHQRTLKQDPPSDHTDRVDPVIRFVASDAPVAEAFCSAWAQKNRITIVLIRSETIAAGTPSESLYAALSASLWRRDYFAEAEPVRDPSEFFGREVLVNELYSKLLVGSPLSVFGLRKIGKSSLLGRLEDLTVQDESSVTATAFLIGNSTRLKAGRWWHAAQDILSIWQSKLQRLAKLNNSRVVAKAERLNDLISKKSADPYSLSVAFERDITALLKAARALQSELNRDAVKLIVFIDECDHLYPHAPDSGHWRTDFFVFWNGLQAIKRSLENPDELVYVLGGVNPSGVEQGALLGQPNPLYELQRIYLGPMSQPDAADLLTGLGSRMGLIFEKDALDLIYEIVGGHPLLLRKLGTAIHEASLNRTERKIVTRRQVELVFNQRKRDFFNQILWIIEHLARVAPDEERLLRDIACGGVQAYGELWGDDEFRETYAYHLQRYGLIHFRNELPDVTLSVIKEALQKPVASGFVEQKKQLKDIIEAIEQSVRIRLRVDLERDLLPSEAVTRVVNAIPSDAKNRALARQDLLDLGAIAGVGAVLESLNWGDFEILLDKFYPEIEWTGPALDKTDRLSVIKKAFIEAHVVRHNNDHALKEMIDTNGFDCIYGSFSVVREMLSA